jgi:hypothetical protein
MKKPQDESSHLLAKSAAQPRTDLTTWEKMVSLPPNIPRPFSYLCESGNQRDFRDKVEQKAQLEYKKMYNSDGSPTNEVYTSPLVIETPGIAFRGDMRHPNIVFENGMNAYSVKRQISRTCCEDPCCCVPAYTCMLPITLICCVSGFFKHSNADEYCAPTSPGDFCGQNQFAGVYRSGWAALAFTRNYHDARLYLSREQNFWRYITYFPEGYIDFNEYSRYLLSHGHRRDPYSFFDDGDGHFSYDGPRDVAEIIPKGTQAVFSANIIAAINNETGEIMINPHSVLYRNGLEQAIRNIMAEQTKKELQCLQNPYIAQELARLFRIGEENPPQAPNNRT